MVYDISGVSISHVFDLEGKPIASAYNIDGSLLTGSAGRYATFSVLADSYGAIANGVTPETNAVYYPADGNDVTEVSQMWWALFAESYGCELLMNNAYSGSRVANDASWYAGIEQCYIGRSENLGDPGLIFILGGTNDVWNGIPLGEYVYSDWTDDNKAEFRGALAYLLSSLQQRHDAKIIVLCNTLALKTNATTWPTQYQYYESMHTVCDHYGVDCVDISPEAVGNHPTAHGMKQIRTKIMKHLGEEPTIIKEMSLSLATPINATWNPSLNASVTDAITQGKLYKVDMTVDAIGSADAYVLVSVTGTTTVNFANFSAYAGQTGDMSMVVEASNYAESDAPTIQISVSGTTRTATISKFKIYEVEY